MTLAITPSTQAVLDLEDQAPDVLFESVAGNGPLWPRYRSSVWSALNTTAYGLSRPSSTTSQSRFAAWAHTIRSFLPASQDAVRHARRGAVCFVVEGGTIFADAGREANWLVGPFAEAVGEGATIVQWRGLPGPLGMPAFKATWSMEPASIRAQTFTRLSRRDVSEHVERIVKHTLGLLDANLSGDAVNAIMAHALVSEMSACHETREFERMLDRVQPKVVLMQEAAYGRRAHLITAMKERGIVVAEPQHGWIGPSHAAYNYGKAMFEEPLGATLPDYLLTFGEFWGRGLRFPGRVVAIGKPHINASVARYGIPAAARSEVLVVSSTTDPDSTAQFVLDMRAVLKPEFKLSLRPHPSERASFRERYGRLLDVEGVTIDLRPDVYEALGSARAVVGVASTVLFEAQAFGCQVYVRQSPMTEAYVGDRFGPAWEDTDAPRIAADINKLDATEGGTTVDTDLWAPDPKARFTSWLSDVLDPPRVVG